MFVGKLLPKNLPVRFGLPEQSKCLVKLFVVYLFETTVDACENTAQQLPCVEDFKQAQQQNATDVDGSVANG